MALFIRSNLALTNPLPGTPLLPTEPFTSDTFNRANGVLAGNTDARLGGKSVPWVGNAGSVSISNGSLIPNPAFVGGWFFGVAEATADIEASFVFRDSGNGSVFMDLHRSAFVVTPMPDSVRLSLNKSTAQFMKRIGGVVTTFGTASIKPGDVLTLRAKGTTFTFLVNGVVIDTQVITDPLVLAPGFTGFAGVAAADRFWAVDDLVITPL